MSATVTTLEPQTTALSIDTSSGSSYRVMLNAIGLDDTKLVFSDVNTLIYKITAGTGTYADQYIRIQPTTSGIPVTVGNLFTVGTSTLSEVGTSVNTRSGTTAIHGYVAVKANDNSFGCAMYLGSTGAPVGYVGYITATPYSGITANTAPLTLGLGCFPALPDTYFGNNYDTNTGTLINKANTLPLRYVTSSTLYGNSTTIGGPGLRNIRTSNSNQVNTRMDYLVSDMYMAHKPFNNRKLVIGPLQVFSGSYPFGFNSKLVHTDYTLQPRDTVIITQGVEEYLVLDSTGVAIRTI